jgi:hypothetical protein
MSYFLRAFCTSADLPPLRKVFEWAESEGVRLEATSVDDDTAEWQQAEIVYRPGRQRFVAEADTDEVLREEVEEFIESLEDADDSREKQRVLDHLERSNAVVAVQLLGHPDADGHRAATTFLTYFVAHCGGLLQADGEGFYDGDRLIVELS